MPSAWAEDLPCAFTSSGEAFNKSDGAPIYLQLSEHVNSADAGSTWLEAESVRLKDRPADLRVVIQRRISGPKMNAIAQAHARFRQLVTRVPIRWVAVEHLPEDFSPAMLREWRRTLARLSRDVARAGVSREEFRRALVYGFSGPVADLILGHAYVKHFEFIGIDSYAIKNAEVTYLNVINQIDTAVLSIFSQARLGEYFEAKLSADGPMAREEIEPLVSEYPESERDAVRLVALAIFKAVELHDRRNQLIARDLLRRAGPGVLTLGDMHDAGLRRYLREFCRIEVAERPTPLGMN